MNTRFLCLVLSLVTLALLPVPGLAAPGTAGERTLVQPVAESIPAPLPIPADCGPLAAQPYPVGPPLLPVVPFTVSPKVMWMVYPPVNVHEFDWIW